jgi:DNA polymerase-3 subunit alpha (Gram-positive type)
MVGGRPHRLFSYRDSNKILPELHFRSTKEMIEEFSFLNDTDLINKIVIDNTYLFFESLEEGIKPIKDGLFAPKIEGSDKMLKEKIYENIHALYGDNPPKIVIDRIENELSIIIDKHFEVIY